MPSVHSLSRFSVVRRENSLDTCDETEIANYKLPCVLMSGIEMVNNGYQGWHGHGKIILFLEKPWNCDYCSQLPTWSFYTDYIM